MIFFYMAGFLEEPTVVKEGGDKCIDFVVSKRSTRRGPSRFASPLRPSGEKSAVEVVLFPSKITAETSNAPLCVEAV